MLDHYTMRCLLPSKLANWIDDYCAKHAPRLDDLPSEVHAACWDDFAESIRVMDALDALDEPHQNLASRYFAMELKRAFHEDCKRRREATQTTEEP